MSDNVARGAGSTPGFFQVSKLRVFLSGSLAFDIACDDMDMFWAQAERGRDASLRWLSGKKSEFDRALLKAIKKKDILFSVQGSAASQLQGLTRGQVFNVAVKDSYMADKPFAHATFNEDAAAYDMFLVASQPAAQSNGKHRGCNASTMQVLQPKHTNLTVSQGLQQHKLLVTAQKHVGATAQ